MGAIITFGTSLALLFGLLVLKVAEESRGSVFLPELRARLDALVLRSVSSAIALYPRLVVVAKTGLRTLARAAVVLGIRLAEVVRKEWAALRTRVHTRHLGMRVARSEKVSEFLKSVSEHKNGIRNGDSP